MKKHLLACRGRWLHGLTMPIKRSKCAKDPYRKDIYRCTAQSQDASLRQRIPALSFTKIKGAPALNYPTYGGNTVWSWLKLRGMGWAYPELRDMDGDGKKDLLVGEFGSRTGEWLSRR